MALEPSTLKQRFLDSLQLDGVAEIRADLTLLKWMVGAVIGLVLLVLGKVW